MPDRPDSWRPPGRDRRPPPAARGYGRGWRQAARRYLAANPSCRSCGRPATVVDHVQPHRGAVRAFWDRANWQPLCASCHGRKTARGA